MYGVPADLNLTRFIGATLEQICIGQFQVQFHFDPPATIGACGEWTLRGPDGVVIDQMQEHAEREAYRLHRLLGQRVVRTSVDPPRCLTLHFESGHELVLYDDSDRYESISIQPGDIYI